MKFHGESPKLQSSKSGGLTATHSDSNFPLLHRKESLRPWEGNEVIKGVVRDKDAPPIDKLDLTKKDTRKILEDLGSTFRRPWLFGFLDALKSSHNIASVYSDNNGEDLLVVYGAPAKESDGEKNEWDPEDDEWEVTALYDLGRKATKHFSLAVFFVSTDRTLGWWVSKQPDYLAVCYVRGSGPDVTGVRGHGSVSRWFEPDALFRGYMELGTGRKVKCRLSHIDDLYTFGSENSEPTVAMLASSLAAAVIAFGIMVAGRHGRRDTLMILCVALVLLGQKYWPGCFLAMRTCALGAAGGVSGILASKRQGDIHRYLGVVELPSLILATFLLGGAWGGEAEWRALVGVILIVIVPVYWSNAFRNRAGEGGYWRRVLNDRTFTIADAFPTSNSAGSGSSLSLDGDESSERPGNMIGKRRVFTTRTDVSKLHARHGSWGEKKSMHYYGSLSNAGTSGGVEHGLNRSPRRSSSGTSESKQYYDSLSNAGTSEGVEQGLNQSPRRASSETSESKQYYDSLTNAGTSGAVEQGLNQSPRRSSSGTSESKQYYGSLSNAGTSGGVEQGLNQSPRRSSSGTSVTNRRQPEPRYPYAYARGYGTWDILSWAVGASPKWSDKRTNCETLRIFWACIVYAFEILFAFLSAFVGTLGSGLGVFIDLGYVTMKDVDGSEIWLSSFEKIVGVFSGLFASIAMTGMVRGTTVPPQSIAFCSFGVFFVWFMAGVPLCERLLMRVLAAVSDQCGKYRRSYADETRKSVEMSAARNLSSSGPWERMYKCRWKVQATYPRVDGYCYYDGELYNVHSGWYFPACGRVSISVPRSKGKKDEKSKTPHLKDFDRTRSGGELFLGSSHVEDDDSLASQTEEGCCSGAMSL